MLCMCEARIDPEVQWDDVIEWAPIKHYTIENNMEIVAEIWHYAK